MSAAETPQPLDVLFVVDPIESLNAVHDSSVALMESVQARGHRILTTTVGELGVREGRPFATSRSLRLSPATLHDGSWHVEPDWFELGSSETRSLDHVDAVFVRTDPPVDAAYLRGTYILDLVDPLRTVVINSPAGLRNANEKLFSLQFPDLCPPTLVSANMADIVATTEKWERAVIKPIEGMAGRGIMLLQSDDPNLRSIVENATTRGRDQVVVQRYIPEASQGDRRLIVLDGSPVGAVRRLAIPGEFRCNMATGAEIAPDTITSQDKRICARLAQQLSLQGLAFVGLDVIGDYLIEVNVTSPTGIREIDAFSGLRLSDTVITWVEDRHAMLVAPPISNTISNSQATRL